MKVPTELLDTPTKETMNTDLKGLISIKHKIIVDDYVDDYNRGTVEYDPKSRNYSFHKVVIPDGTTVSNSNFTQKEPHTDCIAGKNLIFVRCNLRNVKQDVSWTIQDCSAAQTRTVIVKDTGMEGEVDLDNVVKTYTNRYTNKEYQVKEALVSFQVEKDSSWVEKYQYIDFVTTEVI